MTTATVFYSDKKFLAGESICFGVRFDAQIIPSGSVVIGFLQANPQGISQLVSEPAMAENQKQSYIDAIEMAWKVLSDEWEEDSPNVL